MDKIIDQEVDGCPFCRKAITNKTFYSTHNFSALYNIAPVLPGHTLIIPNSHYESLLSLSDDKLAEMVVFARKITTVLQKVFDCNGFDWTVQEGITAGQTIPHLHLHIIPRKQNDLTKGSEWYSMIPESEAHIIDSESRERLNEKDFTTITNKLKDITASFLE